MSAVETAQIIVDSLCDIRPHLAGKRVVRVEVSEGPISAMLVMADDSTLIMNGLYARVISQAKAREVGASTISDCEREE